MLKTIRQAIIHMLKTIRQTIIQQTDKQLYNNYTNRQSDKQLYNNHTYVADNKTNNYTKDIPTILQQLYKKTIRQTII